MTTIDRRYSVAEGTAIKAPCRVATTANITLGGLQTIDGVTVAEHDRVLVKDQTDQTLNGIYEASTGNWQRTKDFDGARDIVKGTKVFVSSGAHDRIEYTITSADPIIIGTTNITFSALGNSILEQAQAAADAAATYASLLGNQVANYNSYVDAQNAPSGVPAGVKGFRVFGWATFGDGPTGEYYRVDSEPSTPAGKIRTADRFLPDGTIDVDHGGWFKLVISGPQDCRKFGIFAGTDATTSLQAALNTCSIFFPPAASNYILSGDILLVSNRRIHVQKGATIINTGGRFTGHLPGGGGIDFEINGTIGFLATADAPQMTTDWPTSDTFGPERGLIEIGGSAANPASNIRIYGGGRVYSDYVWAGVPAGLTNFHFQINRKGIAFWNSAHVLVEGMEVDHIHGEAIYFNGYANNYDIKFLDNYVHDFAFNGLNFNVGLPYLGLLMRGNTIARGMQGIEISGGTADGNQINEVGGGIITGAGGGITLRITNNKINNSTGVGISVEYSVLISDVVVECNEVSGAGTFGYVFGNITRFRIKNNSCDFHGATGSGRSYQIAVTCTAGHVDGNETFNPGPHSTGGFTNLAGNTTIGVNPEFA
jgi:hypothetical protein